MSCLTARRAPTAPRNAGLGRSCGLIRPRVRTPTSAAHALCARERAAASPSSGGDAPQEPRAGEREIDRPRELNRAAVLLRQRPASAVKVLAHPPHHARAQLAGSTVRSAPRVRRSRLRSPTRDSRLPTSPSRARGACRGSRAARRGCARATARRARAIAFSRHSRRCAASVRKSSSPMWRRRSPLTSGPFSGKSIAVRYSRLSKSASKSSATSGYCTFTTTRRRRGASRGGPERCWPIRAAAARRIQRDRSSARRPTAR